MLDDTITSVVTDTMFIHIAICNMVQNKTFYIYDNILINKTLSLIQMVGKLSEGMEFNKI